MDAFIGAVVGALLSAPLAFFFGLERSRHERLEERRALVIAELSRLLFEVQDNFAHWANLSFLPKNYESMADYQEEKGKAAVESNNDLIRCYQSNVAWLDPRTAAKLDQFVRITQEIVRTYTPDLRDIQQQMSTESRQVAARMRSEIPPLREDLIQEFRDILHPIPWWQKVFPYRIRFNPPQQ